MRKSSSITALCDYANRQWAGQVRFLSFFRSAPDSSRVVKKLWKVGGFYTLRHKCYIRQALRLLPGVSAPAKISWLSGGTLLVW